MRKTLPPLPCLLMLALAPLPRPAHQWRGYFGGPQCCGPVFQFGGIRRDERAVYITVAKHLGNAYGPLTRYRSIQVADKAGGM